MEVRQLQTFCVLAEELNFTRTAERVNTVQSNVTSQIKALEEELGSPLFDRLAKRVVLTDAGRRFLPHAEQALAAMEQGQRAVKFDAEPSGPLRIGSPESVLTYRLPQVLQMYRKRYPKVELIFRPYGNEPFSELFESGRLDMAIRMSDTAGGGQVLAERLRLERVFFVAHPEDPLAKARAVQPKDLEGQVLLLTESGCSYRLKIDQMMASFNIRPGNVTEFSSVEALKQCVATGMGIGLLPEIVVAAELKKRQIAVLRWTGPKLDIATHILWHKDKWMSPAMQAFLDLLRQKLQEPEGCAADEKQGASRRNGKSSL
ncbi:LysR family transcriptional regulator [Paracidobacterium acidisoli]|nr:LysR family transcriptional regulator [Paracidobacterium acidisoli]MBT9331845.1 LysR family transcriptional regulator [Paracidobacterium acidisoli]